MATFESIIYYFEAYGVLDFLLPFLLVLTLVFAVLQKIKLFGEDSRKFNIVIAIVLGLTFVVPHVIGAYPLGYDPVQILNETLPSISLVIVASIMLLILAGMFGADISNGLRGPIAIAAIAFVIYIFGAALNWWTGPWDLWRWFDPETTAVVIMLLVAGLILSFIFREPKGSDSSGGFFDALKKLNDSFKGDH